METETTTERFCNCGVTMHPYQFRDQGDDSPYYDAWQTAPEPGTVWAALRQDVLNWRTGFRPPTHDIWNTDGTVLVAGVCRESYP